MRYQIRHFRPDLNSDRPFGCPDGGRGALIRLGEEQGAPMERSWLRPRVASR
jgi:hypothetical protein